MPENPIMKESVKPKTFLLKVVLGSVCFVAISAFLWHESAMVSIETKHKVEQNKVTKNINEMKGYIAKQNSPASSTAEMIQ